MATALITTLQLKKDQRLLRAVGLCESYTALCYGFPKASELWILLIGLQHLRLHLHALHKALKKKGNLWIKVMQPKHSSVFFVLTAIPSTEKFTL